MACVSPRGGELPHLCAGRRHPNPSDSHSAWTNLLGPVTIASWRARTKDGLKPDGNIAYQRPAYLISGQEAHGHHAFFPKILPASELDGAPRFAEQGVDGDLNSFAQAQEELPWQYFVDLQEAHSVGRINVTFEPTSQPTQVRLRASLDGLNWETLFVGESHRVQGIALELDQPILTRWLSIDGIKPDGSHQVGRQMAIGEVQVFGAGLSQD